MLDCPASKKTLIGFAGAPWTLMAYMVEGGGSKTFSKAKRFLYRYPNESHQLLSKITDTTIAYLHKKIDAGADLVQVFDSWAGMLSRELYQEFCIPYLQKINDAIQERVPTIIFSKGAWFSLDQIGGIGSNVVGLDWNITPEYARSILGAGRIVQGNLDPCVLYGHSHDIEQKAKETIEAFGRNQIFNLGHERIRQAHCYRQDQQHDGNSPHPTFLDELVDTCIYAKVVTSRGCLR